MDDEPTAGDALVLSLVFNIGWMAVAAYLLHRAGISGDPAGAGVVTLLGVCGTSAFAAMLECQRQRTEMICVVVGAVMAVPIGFVFLLMALATMGFE